MHLPSHPKRIHQQLFRASFKIAAESMWHVHLRSHTRGSTTSGGGGGCSELHSRLRLQVCASAHLTQKDPVATAVVGRFIQDCCCKYVHPPISHKRIQQQLLLGASFKTSAASMCICPSHPRGSSSSCCWELHSRLLKGCVYLCHLTQKDPASVGASLKTAATRNVHLPISTKEDPAASFGASLKTSARNVHLPS